jgi:hypothetical protein
MLPLDTMQHAFAQFIEYADSLRGDENTDAARHLRALPFIRDLAPLLDKWALDAVPRDVTLAARYAVDAWFPESGGPEFWAQTDRDAERWTTHDGEPVTPSAGAGEDDTNRDEQLLRHALGQPVDTSDISKDEAP